jgi:hypothetical protein
MWRAGSRWLVVLTVTLSAIGRIIHVPDEAPTIQAGLDSLQDGDSVLVALGTYAEALYAPPLRFTLMGDVAPDSGDYPRPVIDPSPLPGADSLGCLYLPPGSQPLLQDLVFRNGASMYPHWNQSVGGVHSLGGTLVAYRCLFDSTYRALYHFRPNGENLADSLSECVFRDVQLSGVVQLDYPVIATSCDFGSGVSAALCAAGRGSRIRQCRFGSCVGGNSLIVVTSDIVVSDCFFTSPLAPSRSLLVIGQDTAGVTVRNNLFSECVVAVAVLKASAYSPQSYLIDDNQFISNRGAESSATCLWVAPYQPYFVGFGGAVSGNLFHNSFGRAPGANAVVTSGVHQWVANRFLETVLDTAALPTLEVQSQAHSTFRDNLFTRTGYALLNDGGTVDAQWNWWGDATGPYHEQMNPQGLGDTIVGEVDFEPWYTDTSFMSAPGIGSPLPKDFVLSCYPNPFNSILRLKLVPSEVGIVRVDLYDVLGRKTKEIWHGPLAFQKEVDFDASGLASGIYFVRVTDVLGRKSLAMAKVVLLK